MRSRVALLLCAGAMVLALYGPTPMGGAFVDFVPAPVITVEARTIYPASGPNDVASGSATDVSGTP